MVDVLKLSYRNQRNMNRILILFLFFSSSSFLFSQNVYPIEKNGRTGMIDCKGREIIPPIFSYIGEFVDGLAPARKEGLAGYIDTTGKFVIQEQYDHSTPFINGAAQVFVGQKPFFIDNKGEILFEHDYIRFSYYNKTGHAIAQRPDTSFDIINKKGKAIVEESFGSVTFLENDYFVVTQKQRVEDKNQSSTVALLDFRGKRVVPFQKYVEITSLGDGFLIAKRDSSGIFDVLNSLGQIKFELAKNWSSYQTILREGVMVFNYYDGQRIYQIAVDTNGQILFDNPRFKTISPFQNGVAFAKDDKFNYYLINKDGKILTDGLSISQAWKSIGQN